MSARSSFDRLQLNSEPVQHNVGQLEELLEESYFLVTSLWLGQALLNRQYMLQKNHSPN